MTKNPIFYSPPARKLKRKRAAKNKQHDTIIQRKQIVTIRPIVVISFLLELIGRNSNGMGK